MVTQIHTKKYLGSGWPTNGYEFNAELSRCENGGKLSWDSENKKIMICNSADKRKEI